MKMIICLLLILLAACQEKTNVSMANMENSNFNPVPTQPAVPAVYSVTQVSASLYHTCAVVSGAMKCWGWNNMGAQADTNYGSLLLFPTPKTLIGSGVTQVSAGYGSSCAVVSGALKCVGGMKTAPGLNENFSTFQTLIPSGVTKITSNGYYNKCAIVSGALKCWGSNFWGQIGDGTTDEVYQPKTIISSGVTDVALGGSFACAVVNGAIKCWGSNTTGELGDGTTISSLLPKTIIASGASKVSTSVDGSTCAIVSGSLKCW